MRINLKLLLSFLIVTFISTIKIYGQTAGPNSAGTGANIVAGGATWTNPTGVTANDGNKAQSTISFFGASDALVATNFGFSIPLTATIDSIGVSIEKSASSGFVVVFDLTIQLTKDGTTTVGTDQSQAGTWPTSDTYYNYGDTTWGDTWTPADINASTFGVYIRAFMLSFGTVTAYVDHVTITVFYTIPTPIELISFDGKVIEDVIELKWQSSWEKNNDFYTIEKSSNGLNYMGLATVDGKGTTEFISEYTYIDPLPFSGNNYYRLKQTDYDGTYEVFKPIMVQYEEAGPMMKIYPNPVVNQEVNLIVNPDLLKGENNNTYIIVRSITGETIHQQSIPTDHLGEKISLNRRFASGMYIVELHSPYGNTSEKLVVN
jgi:hypothetical protein